MTEVLFLNWRDDRHPEGGGSERYVHRTAEALVQQGYAVTLLCAAHDRAPADETRAGVRIVRRGGRFGVYAQGLREVLRSRPRLVVDVQNGVPFLSTLVRRTPVMVLVHHVHREQWRILFGRLRGGIGWWLESRVAVRAYRRCRYVTVSEATAQELAGLGVARERITVVPNGADPRPAVVATRAEQPRLVVLGRLVPHKRVEHALAVLARLRPRWPELTLDVVGEGWWAAELAATAEAYGVTDRVRFHGFVDEQTKHELLAGAWVHVCPSVKEGWGLAVTEAAGHAVPTVAYRDAGGLRESVRDGETGVLAEDLDGLTDAVEGLLADGPGRAATGEAAARHAARYRWSDSGRAFGAVVDAALSGCRTPEPATRRARWTSPATGSTRP